MATLYLILPAVIFLFAIVSESATIPEADVLGPLGSGWTIDISSVDFKGLVSTAGNGSECCEECKEEHPDTLMVNLFMATSRDKTEKSCSCLKLKSKSGISPATVKTGFFSQVCGGHSVDVDGGVGEDRHFVRGSVKRLAYVGVGREDSGGKCCQLCEKHAPGTKMVDYDKNEKTCDCLDVVPGKRPATRTLIASSALCNISEK